MWRDDRTEDFHQIAVNPLLTRYWHSQKLARGSRVLVPLCGKSLDMLWLAQQGHQVVGVELSPIAVKAFFAENDLKATKRRNGHFTCWRSGAISIWCGDFFSLKKGRLGRIDSVFDRAALTALPEKLRRRYVTQLRALIEKKAGLFLLSVEDVAKASGQPPIRIDHEIAALYAEHFEITLTCSQRTHTASGDRADPAFFTDNKLYQLSRRQSP